MKHKFIILCFFFPTTHQISAQNVWEVILGPSYTNVRHIMYGQQIVYNHTENAPLWNIGFQVGLIKSFSLSQKAKLLSGLPYTKSRIDFQTMASSRKYLSANTNSNFQLDVGFSIGEGITNKSGLPNWLTERYCLYLDQDEKVFRYQTHHKPWALNDVKITNLKTHYQIGNISLDRPPDLTHFSPGVKVVAWGRESV